MYEYFLKKTKIKIKLELNKVLIKILFKIYHEVNFIPVKDNY